MIEKKDILDKIEHLPPMPGTIIKLGTLLGNPETELEDIAKVIQYDPGFTADVLKLSNSAYFGFTRQVGSVKEALMRIGTLKTFRIAVAKNLYPLMNKEMEGYNMESGGFWKHSAAVAIAAELLAQHSKNSTEDSFTAGLLHDAGKLIMADYIKNERESFYGEDREVKPFDLLEKDITGINHAEIGADILEKWKFPEPLVVAARFHHNPDNAGEYQSLVDQVHVADAICLSAGLGTGDDGLQYRLSQDSVNRLNLDENGIQEVICKTVDKLKDFEKLFIK